MRAALFKETTLWQKHLTTPHLFKCVRVHSLLCKPCTCGSVNTLAREISSLFSSETYLTALWRGSPDHPPLSPLWIYSYCRKSPTSSSPVACVFGCVCFCVGILWRFRGKEPGIMGIYGRLESRCLVNAQRAFVLLLLGLIADSSSHRSPDGKRSRILHYCLKSREYK